ncbi:unnamed protein product [Amoebophrya sp. A120]|nr:unnamed protein product [Amoebophrya sp. A120]|eukprot:GSA120T00010004001.1
MSGTIKLVQKICSRAVAVEVFLSNLSSIFSSRPLLQHPSKTSCRSCRCTINCCSTKEPPYHSTFAGRVRPKELSTFTDRVRPKEFAANEVYFIPPPVVTACWPFLFVALLIYNQEGQGEFPCAAEFFSSLSISLGTTRKNYEPSY